MRNRMEACAECTNCSNICPMKDLSSSTEDPWGMREDRRSSPLLISSSMLPPRSMASEAGNQMVTVHTLQIYSWSCMMMLTPWCCLNLHAPQVSCHASGVTGGHSEDVCGYSQLVRVTESETIQILGLKEEEIRKYGRWSGSATAIITSARKALSMNMTGCTTHTILHVCTYVCMHHVRKWLHWKVRLADCCLKLTKHSQWGIQLIAANLGKVVRGRWSACNPKK